MFKLCLPTSDRLNIIHNLSNPKFSASSVQGQIEGKNSFVNISCVVYLQNLHIFLFPALSNIKGLIFYALMVEVCLIASNISDNSVKMFNEQNFLCVSVL